MSGGPPVIQMAGLRFGHLLVMSRAEGSRSKSRSAMWMCKCDCGSSCIVSGSHLRTGKTRSCGCLNRMTIAERNTTHGLATVHKREYATWLGIKRRCNSPKNKLYNRYGGRGIKVCDKWEHDFAAFFRDMGQRPSDRHSIDRIDNDGHYSPENCRWATKRQQSLNTSQNLTVIRSDGKIYLSMGEAARDAGIGVSHVWRSCNNYKLRNSKFTWAYAHNLKSSF